MTSKYKRYHSSSSNNSRNSDTSEIEQPPELEREQIEDWLPGFISKLERTTSRSEKCRLIASIDRQEFEHHEWAYHWQYCKFDGDLVKLYDYADRELGWFAITVFQKQIIMSEPSLKNVYLGRSELLEETGKWILDEKLKRRKISQGGEALIVSQRFGETEYAIRVHVFDPFLFTKRFSKNLFTSRIHLSNEYEKAIDRENANDYQIPFHDNVVRNFANIELFDYCDREGEDCIGWLTIMEKCDQDIRPLLKENRLILSERMRVAEGVVKGFHYLFSIGIAHYDKKLENFLLLGDEPRICDFGLVTETTGRIGYRQMGYTRKGSKFRHNVALAAGSPGFAVQWQLTPGGDAGKFVQAVAYFFVCEWKTAWTLLYKPINEDERDRINEIMKDFGASIIEETVVNHDTEDLANYFYKCIGKLTDIISLDDASSDFCLDDSALTQSCQLADIKQSMTKCVNIDMENLTQNILDQKYSNLCVPISVTVLIRYAMKNDLGFVDLHRSHSIEHILAVLVMIIYPRSMVGLCLNPTSDDVKRAKENENQKNQIELLLNRVCQKTYLMESGWEIIRMLGFEDAPKPDKSICEFNEVYLNENFVFERPVTATGVCLLFDGEVIFHQMTIDRIENGEYVLQNTAFEQLSESVLRIRQTQPYYEFQIAENIHHYDYCSRTQTYSYNENGVKMKMVNETIGNMRMNTWYLMAPAYTLQLSRI